MKIRKLNISIVAMLLLIALGCSTNEDDLMQGYTTGAVFPEITEVESPFFDILDIDNAYVNFTVTVDLEQAESITIEKTYKGSKTQMGTFTTVPVAINVTAEQAVEDIDGVTKEDLELGDVFTFEVVVTSKTGLVSRSNVLVNAPVACKSDVSGEVAYEVLDSDLPEVKGQTGTLTWDEVGTGIYDWDTFTFGGYQALYGCCEQERGATILTVSDVCNVLSMRAADGFGCGWSISSIDENAGSVLTLTVRGECLGFYQVKFTRSDGSDWPTFSL